MAVPVNASIVEHFQTLEDPRIERTKKHTLLDILVIALCTRSPAGKGSRTWNSLGRVSAPGSKPARGWYTTQRRVIAVRSCNPIDNRRQRPVQAGPFRVVRSMTGRYNTLAV